MDFLQILGSGSRVPLQHGADLRWYYCAIGSCLSIRCTSPITSPAKVITWAIASCWRGYFQNLSRSVRALGVGILDDGANRFCKFLCSFVTTARIGKTGLCEKFNFTLLLTGAVDNIWLGHTVSARNRWIKYSAADRLWRWWSWSVMILNCLLPPLNWSFFGCVLLHTVRGSKSSPSAIVHIPYHNDLVPVVMSSSLEPRLL